MAVAAKIEICGHAWVVMGGRQWARLRRERRNEQVVVSGHHHAVPEGQVHEESADHVIARGTYVVCRLCLTGELTGYRRPVS